MPKKGKEDSDSGSGSGSEEEEYVVEKIVDKRVNKGGKVGKFSIQSHMACPLQLAEQ